MKTPLPLSILLAEILRLQRWAGGETASADRIFGLLHGFESILQQESESFGISRELQEKVEDIIHDVENGRQSADGFAIKQRLLSDKIDETTAGRVIKLCILQGRFPEGTEKLVSASSHFHNLMARDAPELQWLGSLHYLELVDCTEDAHKKLHACFAPSIPRTGEVLTPENGSSMRVVNVEWVMTSQVDDEGLRQNVLVPYVYLKHKTESDA
jgi:hypothetical protein